MRRTLSRKWMIAAAAAGLLVLTPVAGWLALTYEPGYYRAMVPLAMPRERIEGNARRFVSRSLQLHNDIRNEPTWEAVFSDEEVNAWLADDLAAHFGDQLPPEVREPRILFESDRVILAFRLDRGFLSPVVTVVARPSIPEDNTVELTLERIRAGILPVPADRVLDRIIERGRAFGVDAAWRKVDGLPVVRLRYTPNPGRDDVRLDDVDVRAGRIRLAGRSDLARGAFLAPTLPSRRILQSTFPRASFHRGPAGSIPSPRGILVRRTSPTS